MAASQIDRKFIWLLATTILLGFVALASASGPSAFKDLGDPYGYVTHQLIYGLLPGIVVFYLLMRTDHRRLRDFAPYALVASVALLLLVFVPGIGQVRRGVQSWVGFAGIVAQPVEVVKLFFLVHLAAFFERRGSAGVADPTAGLMPFLTSLGVVAVLLMLQPDLGSLLVIGAMAFTVYVAAGAPWSHVLGIAGAGAAAVAIAIMSAPYRLERFLIFMNPGTDPLDQGWHVNQAWTAIGTGGIFGLGLGHSQQKLGALPEVIGDSIFAVMAEELGFVFMLAVLVLFAWLTIRMVRIARRAPDPFGRFLALGIAAWVFAQTFMNIGSVVGLTPLTGLPLPFVSYGGTSLVSLMAAMGIVANISVHADRSVAARHR